MNRYDHYAGLSLRPNLAYSLPAICFFLCGCISQQKLDNVTITGQAVNECMHREAPAVAKTDSDLQTAATALMARCAPQRFAMRRAIFEIAPAYPDMAARKADEHDRFLKETASEEIALLRTRQ